MPRMTQRFRFPVKGTVWKESLKLFTCCNIRLPLSFHSLRAISGNSAGSLMQQKIRQKKSTYDITEAEMLEPQRHPCRHTNWYCPWGILCNKIKLAPSNNSIKSLCLCLQMGCNGACLVYKLSWLNGSSPRAPCCVTTVLHSLSTVSSIINETCNTQARLHSKSPAFKCPSFALSDQGANGLYSKESEAFCWAKWKFLASCDQSMESLQSLPPLNWRNWQWLQVTDSFWDRIKFGLLVHKVGEVKGDGLSTNGIQFERKLWEQRVRKKDLVITEKHSPHHVY